MISWARSQQEWNFPSSAENTFYHSLKELKSVRKELGLIVTPASAKRKPKPKKKKKAKVPGPENNPVRAL